MPTHTATERPNPTTLPRAVARPLLTWRIHNDVGRILCRGFQGVTPRFEPNPIMGDVAEFPSEHVALRVIELLELRAHARYGTHPIPFRLIAVQRDWSTLKGGWYVGKTNVDATAVDTAQLELGEPLTGATS